ncbi:MAG: FG-GAP repeat protein, partial [Rhodanobacteraceae bacterium]
VYVFVRSGTSWIQEARLTAADAIPRDSFGSSVALDGDTLLAGAPIKRNAAGGSYANGAAYAFTRDAGGWAQQAKLLPSVAADGDLFGFAVDVAGDRAVIGAPYALASKGTAYVFTRSGTAWSQRTQLGAVAGAAGDEFGWSVALGDDRVVVGAPFAGQIIEAACGASYSFEGPNFVETSASAIAQPMLNELVGWSVAASGARWVVSAPGHIVGIDDHAGAAYWFDSAERIFSSGFELPAQALCVPKEGD